MELVAIRWSILFLVFQLSFVHIVLAIVDNDKQEKIFRVSNWFSNFVLYFKMQEYWYYWYLSN